MKHLRLFEAFENDQEWLASFEQFLDHPWQEDSEIEIVSELSEFRSNFVNSPSGAHDYFLRWTEENEEAVDKMMPNVSDKFISDYDELRGSVNEFDNFAKNGMLHVDLMNKYKDGQDETIEKGFEKMKVKIEGFTERNEKHDLKVGDVIEFTGGYDEDIRFTTRILGFNDENKAYVLWDAFWFPINLDDRSIKVIKRI